MSRRDMLSTSQSRYFLGPADQLERFGEVKVRRYRFRGRAWPRHPHMNSAACEACVDEGK